MKKLLPVLLASLLFLAFQGTSWAAPVDINSVLNNSKTSGSPLGDCLGPDGNHFQATKEACDAFNKAWGKSPKSFEVGKPSPIAPSTSLAVIIAQAEANGSAPVDCVGPDKKQLSVPQEVCDKLNIAWKKKAPAPIVLSSKSTAPATAVSSAPVANGAGTPDLVSIARDSLVKGSPLGDCVGPDKTHFDATREVCDAFNKNWGKPAPFTPGKTTGVGIQPSLILPPAPVLPKVTGEEGKSSGGSAAPTGGSTNNIPSIFNLGGSSNAGSKTESNTGSGSKSSGSNKGHSKTEKKGK